MIALLIFHAAAYAWFALVIGFLFWRKPVEQLSRATHIKLAVFWLYYMLNKRATVSMMETDIRKWLRTLPNSNETRHDLRKVRLVDGHHHARQLNPASWPEAIAVRSTPHHRWRTE